MNTANINRFLFAARGRTFCLACRAAEVLRRLGVS